MDRLKVLFTVTVIVVVGCGPSPSSHAPAAPREAKQKPRPSGGSERKEPSPLVVMLEDPPWNGPPRPSIIVYDNGLVIYAHEETVEPGSPQYVSTIRFKSTVLGTDELDAFLSSMSLDKGFFGLKGHYKATNGWDIPGVMIWAANNDKANAVCVDGLYRLHGTDDRTDTELLKIRSKTPKPFLKVFDQLVAFDRADAKPWLPSSFDLRLTSARNGADAKPWPNNLPDSKHLVARNVSRSSSEEIYMITLDWQYAKAVDRIIYFGRPITFRGKSYDVAFRYRFPNENVLEADLYGESW